MNLQLVIILCLGIGVFGKKDRIVGGDIVEIDDHPFMVSLRNIDPDFHFCSGSIISEFHVLTAAHCLFYKQDELNNIRIYSGSTTPGPKSGVAHKILRLDIHPAFEGIKTSSHDIAVVRVTEPIKFNKAQKSILLPIGNFRENNQVTVLGWGVEKYPSTGISPFLRKMRMKILKKTKCNSYYETPLPKQQFCAFDKQGVGVCHGDSGGPVILNGRIIGITSINIPCAKGYPDIFINVFDYVGFINYAMGKKEQ